MNQAWWQHSLISAFRKLWQEDREFKANRATEGDPISKVMKGKPYAVKMKRWVTGKEPAKVFL